MKKLILLLILVIASVSACKKGDEPQPTPVVQKSTQVQYYWPGNYCSSEDTITVYNVNGNLLISSPTIQTSFSPEIRLGSTYDFNVMYYSQEYNITGTSVITPSNIVVDYTITHISDNMIVCEADSVVYTLIK